MFDRTESVINQLKTSGITSNISPPKYSHYGGEISEQLNLILSATEGKIYFTIDETDPREEYSGNIRGVRYTTPINITSTTTVMSRAFLNKKRSALRKVSFQFKKGEK